MQNCTLDINTCFDPNRVNYTRVTISDPDGKNSVSFFPRTPSTLAIGDVITLKSGGPNMTIIKINDEKAECCYFEYTGGYLFTLGNSQTQKFFTFPLAALKKCQPI